VKGILVTEGVRGEGGILLNKENKRFMFDDIPENYRPQTATTEEEGWRYVRGDKNALRPPELLTRDHVARCINREVKAGRGSPHGGVFLDIAWIHDVKARIPNLDSKWLIPGDAREHIKKKLPSMYHQFKELGGLDITTEQMEVGPTTHYCMGGIHVNGFTQMSTVPGLFAAGEAAGGLHGANRLGGNSLSDLIVFGKRAGEHAAKWAKEKSAGWIDENEVKAAMNWSLSFIDAPAGDENPYAVQQSLQKMMQANVGIVRVEDEMKAALDGIQTLKQRALKVQAPSNREYNPGWHTCMDLQNLLICAEACTLGAIERKESRGGQFRDDFPDKSGEFAKVNMVVKKGADGRMVLTRVPVKALSDEQKQAIEENKA
jgi:succinate dehydrogenase / fumarate reductase flavoprotein subunit